METDSVHINKEDLITSFSDFEDGLKEELLRKGKMSTFDAGDKIIGGGEMYNGAVLIIDGLVKLFRKSEDGDEIFMYYLQPGEAAYLSVLDSENINISELLAVAEKKTTVLSVPYKTSNDWITQFRTWYAFIVRSYRRRFEELFRSLDYMAFRGLDERLMDYLRRQMNIFNTNELNLSHKEIANDLNTSREVISRLLKKMEQRGLITLSRNKIKIEKLGQN